MSRSRIEVTEESEAGLTAYAQVSIAFEVRQVLEIGALANRASGLVLAARDLDAPYMKDYDSLPGEGPLRWPERFDLSYWGLFAANLGPNRVGAAAVALGAPDVDLCEGRSDLAVLWDIRVSPEARRAGVGSALFHAVEAWASARGGRQLTIETQDTNVPACQFYARQGCTLGAINRFAYRELPHEVQLLWHKDLSAGG